MSRLRILSCVSLLLVFSCTAPAPSDPPAHPRYGIYSTVPLTADLSHLSDNQEQMVRVLIQAADLMDDLFWRQAYGDRDALLAAIHDPAARQGDGDYAGATAMLEQLGRIGPELQADLDRLSSAGIPVDIVFEQGPDLLDL